MATLSSYAVPEMNPNLPPGRREQQQQQQQQAEQQELQQQAGGGGEKTAKQNPMISMPSNVPLPPMSEQEFKAVPSRGKKTGKFVTERNETTASTEESDKSSRRASGSDEKNAAKKAKAKQGGWIPPPVVGVAKEKDTSPTSSATDPGFCEVITMKERAFLIVVGVLVLLLATAVSISLYGWLTDWTWRPAERSDQ